MRLKYYIRGLGTGILFCVIVMSLTGAYDKPTMSDTEIMNAAKSLGMVNEESKVNLSVLSPTPTQTPTPDPTIEPTPTQTPTPVPTKVPPTQKEPEDSEGSEKKTVTLVIVKGMVSNTVAKEAYRLGLIDDIAEFDKYMSSNGYASKIRIGTYEIQVGATFWEIAAIITKR